MELSDNDNFKDIFILWDKSTDRWFNVIGMMFDNEINSDHIYNTHTQNLTFELIKLPFDKPILYPYNRYDYVLYNKLTNGSVSIVNISEYNKIAGKVWDKTQGIKLFYNYVGYNCVSSAVNFELKLKNITTIQNCVEGNTLNDFYSFINDSIMNKNNILSKKEKSLKKIKSEYEPKIKRKLTL